MHPDSFFRRDLAHEPGALPGSSVDGVRRDVLEALDAEVAILNADDAVTVC